MNSFKIKNLPGPLLALLILTGLGSCKKYNSEGFTPGTGAPAITSVHTLSKGDTALIALYATTLDASGNSTIINVGSIQNSHPFDSVTNAGYLGNYYVLHGSNLGSATKITFNGTISYFNRALSTDNTIIVAVPGLTPYFGPKATDSLVVTTLYGTAYYKFTIIPPPPTPITYSNYNFSAGSQITMTGVGFGAVTGVKLVNLPLTDSATLTIVNQNDSVITIQFPSTTMIEGFLKFNYSAAGAPAAAITTQSFVDRDNAYIIFDDNYANSWEDGSWHHPSGPSTTQVKSGTTSFMATFPAGQWQIESFQNWYPSLPYTADYKYVSFWVKGGTVNHILNLQTNTSSTGFGQNGSNPITVPANVWTYFKLPISGINTIDFWTSGKTLQQLGFFLKGQGGDVDETYYFDDVMLVK
ncbi:MAG: hypothetical protein ABI091_19650 [Ferruginibacter sp.]